MHPRAPAPPKLPAPSGLRIQTAALVGCAPKPLQWLRSLITMFHILNIHRKLPMNIIFQITVFNLHRLFHMFQVSVFSSYVSVLILHVSLHNLRFIFVLVHGICHLSIVISTIGLVTP